MRYELKSVPIWPLTKVAFFVHLVFGFLLGIFYAVMLMPFVALMSGIPEFQAEGLDVGAAPLGVLMMMLPFFTALSGAFFGTLFSVVLALIYNLMARLVGGLELDLAAKEGSVAPVAAPIAAASQAPSYAAAPPPPPPVEGRPATPPPPVIPAEMPEEPMAETKRDETGSDSSLDRPDLM